MIIIFRAFCDPGFENLDLLWTQGFVGLRRRHELIEIGRLETLDDLALCSISWRENSGIQRILSIIETQVAFRFTRPVTFEAGVRKDGAHVTIKIDRSREQRTRNENQNEEFFHN